MNVVCSDAAKLISVLTTAAAPRVIRDYDSPLNVSAVMIKFRNYVPHLHLVPRSRLVALYLHFPIHFHCSPALRDIAPEVWRRVGCSLASSGAETSLRLAGVPLYSNTRPAAQFHNFKYNN